ncbi:pectin methylesterase [Phytophthora cinnamomi]|uniref:pectin methylesterase n=1 Tax=Phytophthora cinnamomi TaxID=4785 RepID=UPI003559A55E|nr:pectin methylesterase [Phytophthora cinnamomi]
MHFFTLLFVTLASLVAGAAAQVNTTACNGPNARTVPPPGAIVVDITGTYNDSYQTVAEGMAYLPNTTEEHTLFLFPGVYQEQVLIPKLAGPLVIQGYTCDTMSYAENKVTITHTMAQRDLAPEIKNSRNELVSTMRFKSSSGVKMYNVNVANPTGKIENLGQAVAVYVNAPNHGFYGCNFTGYQDTLCAHKGRELYSRSYISGAVDFVFGMQAKAWFESCDFETIGKGWITANGNKNSSNLSEYVFNRARVFGSSGNGSTYLGRPWYPYAYVIWQNSELSDVVNPAGWSVWNNGTSTANVTFKEFNNSGPGAATDKRVSFSGQLNAPVAITELLGEGFESEWWVDTKFL